jgi:peptidoglycan hydrolase-like protein with peptidoglycan-binding domain
MANIEGDVRLLTADPFDSSEDLIKWINVSRETKQFANNLAIDVAVVQFLLKSIYDADLTLLRPVKPVKVDGDFGPNTATWVKHFQSSSDIQDRIRPRKFLPVRPDGIVSRAPGNGLQSRLFAIYRLNWAMAKLQPFIFDALIGTIRVGKLSVEVLKTRKFPVPVQVDSL